MNKLKMIAAFSLAFFTLPGYSATLISKEEASTLQKIGEVSITGVRGSTDDAVEKLSMKADEAGAEKFGITSLGTSGDSSLFHGTANLYK